MNKQYIYPIIPSVIISMLFFNVFSLLTRDDIEKTELLSIKTNTEQIYSSGDISDNCTWYAINMNRPEQCWANPTSSFGPPDKLYIAINSKQSVFKKLIASDIQFCHQIASLESTANGVREISNGQNTFPVRWVCPLLKGEKS